MPELRARYSANQLRELFQDYAASGATREDQVRHGSQDSTEAVLTPQQLQRIAENQERALERQRLKRKTDESIKDTDVFDRCRSWDELSPVTADESIKDTDVFDRCMSWDELSPVTVASDGEKDDAGKNQSGCCRGPHSWVPDQAAASAIELRDTSHQSDVDRGKAIRRLAFQLDRAYNVLLLPSTAEKIADPQRQQELQMNLEAVVPKLRPLLDSQASRQAIERAAYDLYRVLQRKKILMKPAWGNTTRKVGALYPATREERLARKALRLTSDVVMPSDFIRGALTLTNL